MTAFSRTTASSSPYWKVLGGGALFGSQFEAAPVD
jgi:hypothetical protein